MVRYLNKETRREVQLAELVLTIYEERVKWAVPEVLSGESHDFSTRTCFVRLKKVTVAATVEGCRFGDDPGLQETL